MARIVAQPLGLVVVQCHGTLALTHGLLERGHDAFARVVGDHQTVDHQIDVVDLVTVELHARRDLADLAVDARIDVSAFGQRLEHLAIVALAALHDGSHERHLAAREALEDQIADLLVGVVHHLLVGNGRIGARGAGIEQAQEVVDLGDGAHRRTGVLVGGLLLDGHHGAESRYLVHVGTLHSADELSGIGRKGLHVAALPLGVDGIESERRFTRPRDSRDNDQRIARNLDIRILEIVDARARHDYLVFPVDCHNSSLCVPRPPHQNMVSSECKISCKDNKPTRSAKQMSKIISVKYRTNFTPHAMAK